MCFAPQWPALFRHLNFQNWSEPDVFCTFSLPNVLRAIRAFTFSTSQLPKVLREWCALPPLTSKCLSCTTECAISTPQRPKVVRDPGVLPLFTSKCASRHKRVQFFNISTSKSGPSMRCFDTFYFKMCFAPQRRAIFHFSSAQMSPHPPL